MILKQVKPKIKTIKKNMFIKKNMLVDNFASHLIFFLRKDWENMFIEKNMFIDNFFICNINIHFILINTGLTRVV
jgi:hypothetical protein